MTHKTELRLLFATSFSDSCFRTIRAVAQLVDNFRVDLTLAHAHNPSRHSRRQVERELDSFFPEADYYGPCRRVILEGESSEAIGKLTADENYDLVIAPSSDRMGILRLLHSSTRARILKNAQAPLWTMGSAMDQADFRAALKNIACVVDFNCPNLNHLRLAAALANRLDGKLKLLTAVPAVDEGTLAEVCLSDAPVHPNAAMERIRDLAASLPSSPEVSIAVGRPAREIPRLAKQCGADLLFAGPGQTLSDGWGPVRLHPMVNQMPCPVICVDGASSNKAAWSFESVQAEERLVPVEQRVPVRAESREMVAATASR